MKNCDSYKGLLVGLIDRELTPEETEEINSHLIRCESCRQEYEQLRTSLGKLGLASFKEPQDAILDQVWRRPYSRFTRNASLFLIVGGYAALIGYGFYEFFTKEDEAAPMKVAMLSIVLGFVFLLVQLIRERIRTWKTDPYKEIQR